MIMARYHQPRIPMDLHFLLLHVVFLSKFLTMMTKSNRYITKLLPTTSCCRNVKRWLPSHSTADLIWKPILSRLSSWAEIHLSSSFSTSNFVLVHKLFLVSLKIWPNNQVNIQWRNLSNCALHPANGTAATNDAMKFGGPLSRELILI